MSVQVKVAWAMAGPNNSVIRSEVTAAGSLPRERFAWQQGSAWRSQTTPDGTTTTVLDRELPAGTLHAREAWNVMQEALLRGDLLSLPAMGGDPVDRAKLGVMELAVEVRMGNQQPLTWHYDLRDGVQPDQVMQLFRTARSFHQYMRTAPPGDGAAATSAPAAVLA